MSPPLHSVGEEEAESNVTLLVSSASMESVCQHGSYLKERNYMGLSDCSSVDSSTISTSSEDNNARMNLKATELRLGLPGSQSPERNLEFCWKSAVKLNEKPLFPLHPLKAVVSGNKRGYSDTMDAFSEGKYTANVEVSVKLTPRPSSNAVVKIENPGASLSKLEVTTHNAVNERPRAANEPGPNHSTAAPATKAQVVGWPPIRSFRKNSLATTSKNVAEVDGKAGVGALFVKVSMDGAPYLRKVDLRTYSVYQELSSALEKMFTCFTIGQYGSHGAPGKEMLSESKLKDLLHGSEYVLTYEDKDGDWMLVGDVPWEMFITTCKRLRIMKSSDAIGLAPRSVEKSLSRN